MLGEEVTGSDGHEDDHDEGVDTVTNAEHSEGDDTGVDTRSQVGSLVCYPTIIIVIIPRHIRIQIVHKGFFLHLIQFILKLLNVVQENLPTFLSQTPVVTAKFWQRLHTVFIVKISFPS